MGIWDFIKDHISADDYLKYTAAHWGEGDIYTAGCQCAACTKFRSLIHPEPGKDVLISSDGWCDPRRGYLESEEDFLRRVPDGILHWPEDHK